ncbi:HPP family protein [Candidatus Aenigmatarchaeota archaeon]
MEKIKELPVEKVMRKKFNRVKISDKISKIIKLFLRSDITVLPVFDGKKFAGEIHELDLLKLVVDPKEIPEEEIVVLGFGMDMGYFAKTAGDIVRRHNVSVSPNTKIKEASYTMLKENVKAIPVIKNKILVGILTERDILNRVIKEATKK